ncbi:MAG: hypothetical protein QOC67_4900 [Pseudonocardiales bacterium]|nr:hypothetical protein [Pseudonocardiales bacterium]
MTPTSAVPSTPGARPWAAATQTEAAGPATALAPATSSGPTMEISSWLAASRPNAASNARGQGSSGGVARAEAASTAVWPRRSGPGGPDRRGPAERLADHTQRTRCTPESRVAAALLCAHIRNSDAHPPWSPPPRSSGGRRAPCDTTPRRSRGRRAPCELRDVHARCATSRPSYPQGRGISPRDPSRTAALPTAALPTAALPTAAPPTAAPPTAAPPPAALPADAAPSQTAYLRRRPPTRGTDRPPAAQTVQRLCGTQPVCSSRVRRALPPRAAAPPAQTGRSTEPPPTEPPPALRAVRSRSGGAESRSRAARAGSRPGGTPASTPRRTRTPSARTATAGNRTAAAPPTS